MKIIVLGSRGMAGHVVTRYLREQRHEVLAVARSGSDFDLDIEKTEDVRRFFDHHPFRADFVVNCIGLLVRDSINRPDRAAVINSWFPHYVEHRLRDTPTRLVHLSTDCVFDGTRGYYQETETPTEVNAYGASKALGEVRNNKDITMRMSIIGPEIKNGTGLLHWVTANQDQELPGWDNAWWNGITTLQLAKCIDRYINDPRPVGVRHVVNNKVKINKYDLLRKINEVYGLGKTIHQTQGPKTVNKVLLDTQEDYDWAIPDYDTQLKQLRDWY